MKYPLGRQDFRDIRERGLVYVDKTREVCAVADLRTYLFLARPRRFGKSLTVATLAELHSGDRELFKGLWAYDHWDFPARHSSVVWLRFASSGFASSGIEFALHGLVSENAARLGVSVPDESVDYAKRFAILLEGAAAVSPSGKAVLLVDEYDKPITHHIEGGAGGTLDEGIHETLRVLKAFYGVLKDADRYLELAFITGVSAFSKVSLFSDLNNLINLTLNRQVATLVGLTEEEITDYFEEDIAATGVSRETLRQWYNGYRFAANAERVYNPWSVLTFLFEGYLGNYWYETGTPSWLIRYMLTQPTLPRLEAIEEHKVALVSFDVRAFRTIPLLFQSGYLTIDGFTPVDEMYTLRFPNREVEEAFGVSLLDAMVDKPDARMYQRVTHAGRALRAGRLEDFFAVLSDLLASIAYTLYDAKSESAYHVAAHTLLHVADVRSRSEASSARGRADTIVETSDYVYCFEFKVGRTPAEAIAQIRERGYLDAFRADPRECIAVGVSFDAEKRNVGEWVAESIK